MHGWPDVTGSRYGGTTWLWILCVLWTQILVWALQPW